VYAVVRTGGKQYRVQEGREVTVERLSGEPGDAIELGDVLLMGEGEDVTIGSPVIEGARVLGTIAEQGRAKKIVVFRYKAKTRSRKKTGHRQHFTRITVEDILAPGQEPKPKPAPAPVEEPAAEAPKARRRRKKEEAQPETVVAEIPEPAEAVGIASEPVEAPADEPPSSEADEAAPAAAADAEPETKPKRGRKKTE